MYLTVESLLEINKIIINSYNITLRKVNEKPCAFDKIYMDIEIIEDKLYQIIDHRSIKLHLVSFIQYS